MATRTVSVLLTGTVTPYVSAMRSAARTTQTTARSIEADMRRAASTSAAAMTSMARAAEAQASRAGAGFERMAGRAGAEMSRLGAQGSAAMSRVGAGVNAAAAELGSRFPAATARAGSMLSEIGARGATAFAAVGSSASAAASAVSSRWSSAGARVSAAMAGARSSADSAASWVSSRWSAAAASVSGAFSSMRLAAYSAGAGIMGVATDGRRTLEGLRTASLGLVAVFGLAALAAAKFEKSMSEVRAVTGGSAKDMKALSQAALDAGQATVYSATQAANAEAELARAGISTADIIGGALKGSLDLAASGQLELGESAIISAQAMNAFKLSGKDVGHIADVISAGAGKSATNVHDMGMAFRQAALLSSQTGLSLEQTVGSLSLFAQNALTGSDAGTSLKVMLQRLVPQSNEAQAAMDAIGFSAYDAQGNFIGLSALAGQMKASFSQLTPEARNAAMATIFGSDAVRAATILYEAGSEGIDGWVKAVNDQGYATRVASTMTDNLAGDLERLKGSLETALISSGSGANKVLREMAQVLTSVVNWYGQLSPSVQTSVTAMAGLAGVVTFVGTGLLLMLPRIMAVRAELAALGVTAARTRAMFTGFMAVGGVVAGLAAISWGIDELKKKMDDAPPSADKLTNSLLTFTQTGKASGELAKTFGSDLMKLKEAMKQVGDPSFTDRIAHISESMRSLNESGWGTGVDTTRMKLKDAQEGIKGIDQALTNLVQSGSPAQAETAFQQIAAQLGLTSKETDKLKGLLPGYTNALAAADTQTRLNESGQDGLKDALTKTNDEIQDQRSAAEKLKDALSALNGVAISAAEKEIAFRASLADLTDAVKENGHSLDVTTEKGRAVKGAFLDAASAALAHAEATAQQQNSVEAGNAVLEQDIAILKRQMRAAGFSTEAIETLIGAYARVPSNVTTKVGAPGATQSTAELEALRVKIASVPAGKSITVQAPTGAAIQALRELGYTVNTLPDGRVTITVPTAGAIQSLNNLQAHINALHGKDIGITTHYATTGNPYPPSGGRSNREANGGLIRGYAGGGDVQWMPSGGPVFGPGTPTSDSVPTWLSTGEYVIKAASVRKHGLAAMDRLNAGYAPSPGYTARPAGRMGGGLSGGQIVQQVTKHYTINLHGAKQSSADQAADIARHLQFVG